LALFPHHVFPPEICQENVIPLNTYLFHKKIQGAEDIQIKDTKKKLSIAARRVCADRIKRRADKWVATPNPQD